MLEISSQTVSKCDLRFARNAMLCWSNIPVTDKTWWSVKSLLSLLASSHVVSQLMMLSVRLRSQHSLTMLLSGPVLLAYCVQSCGGCCWMLTSLAVAELWWFWQDTRDQTLNNNVNIINRQPLAIDWPRVMVFTRCTKKFSLFMKTIRFLEQNLWEKWTCLIQIHNLRYSGHFRSF